MGVPEIWTQPSAAVGAAIIAAGFTCVVCYSQRRFHTADYLHVFCRHPSC